jgi:hypothetical protein
LSAISRKRITATETIGTITIRRKNSVRRARKLMASISESTRHVARITQAHAQQAWLH